MFVILQDVRGRLSYAPESWVKLNDKNEEVVFWPKRNQTSLQNDPTSEPIIFGDNKWLEVNDVVKRRGILSKELAEKEMDVMMMTSSTDETDSEQIIRRPNKFQSKGSLKSVPKYNIDDLKKRKLVPAINSSSPSSSPSPSLPLTPKSKNDELAMYLQKKNTPVSQKLSCANNSNSALPIETLSPLLSSSQLTEIGSRLGSIFPDDFDLNITYVSFTIHVFL